VEGARDVVWHQRFELAPGVWSPGAHDIGHLLTRFGLPDDSLRGRSFLDIGTTNGGAAFLAELAGAARVVAVDIYDDRAFGFAGLRELLDARVEFVQASVYELPSLLDERFDVVCFLGVLYHLRHPLLAVDAVRELSRGRVLVESAICDGIEPWAPGRSAAAFYRRDEVGGDWSNWFLPTARTLRDWFESSGFEVRAGATWPAERPERALLDCVVADGEPEFRRRAYEKHLWVTSELTR
jgi:tRNA (mo5U34)-methyltransferase